MAIEVATVLTKFVTNLAEYSREVEAAERRTLTAAQRVNREAADMRRQWASAGLAASAAFTLAASTITEAFNRAASFEGLKRGLTAVTGSAQETDRQLARLKEAAKQPGLTFREAIEGSRNLQAAGLSAEFAERSLKAFGNALAIGGRNTPENLQGVFLALQQISNTPTLQGDELRQLQERLPQLSRLLMDAFGTARSEDLKQMQISSKQVLETLVSGLEKLPRASGGALTAIEDLQDAWDQALVAFGNPFLQPVAAEMVAMTGALEKNGDAFKEWGQNVGEILRTFRAVAESEIGSAAASLVRWSPLAIGLRSFAGYGRWMRGDEGAPQQPLQTDIHDAGNAVRINPETMRPFANLAKELKELASGREILSKLQADIRTFGDDSKVTAVTEQFRSFREALKASNVTLSAEGAASVEELGRALTEEARRFDALTRQAEARKRAEAEASRQSDVIKQISRDYAEASIRVTRFGQSNLELEAALYKLSIGYSTLSEARKKEAQEEINRLFSAKAEEARLQLNEGLHQALTKSIDANVEAMVGSKTAVEELNKLYVDWSAETRKATGSTAKLTTELDDLMVKARRFARQRDIIDGLNDLAAAMERISVELPDFQIPDFKLPGDTFGNEGPWVNPETVGPAPPNYYEEQLRRLQQMQEVGEDLADIFSNVFNSVEDGWRGMWDELLNISRNALQDISRELMKMAFTGQQSGAGGIIGLAANWLGAALGVGLGSNLPMAGASKMGGSYLQPSSFVGGFAEGGYIPPGKWGMTGERGPEPVFGGRTGATVIPNSKAGQTVIHKTTVINYQPRTVPNSVTSRRSQRETFEALLAFVR